MAFQASAYAASLIVSSAISAMIGLLAWRRRTEKGAIPLMMLMLGTTWWSLGYAMEILAVDLTMKILLAKIEYLAIVSVPIFWFVFALQYCRPSPIRVRKRLILLFVIPTTILLLVWTNELHGLIWANIRLEKVGTMQVFAKTYGVGFLINALYSYILMLAGAIILLYSLIRLPDQYRGQFVSMLAAAVAPMLGNYLTITGTSPFPNLDLTPFGFTVAGLIVGWGLLRYKLLDIIPVARDAVFENMSDLVLVLDLKNRIVDANPAAIHALNPSGEDLAGEPIGKVLGQISDLTKRLIEKEIQNSEIHLLEGETHRWYDLRISPLYDKQGQKGRLIVLRDITDRKNAEEALQRAHDELELKVQERTTEIRTILEASPDAITVIDVDGTIVECNHATLEIHGYSSKDEIVGMNIITMIAPHNRESARLDLQETLTLGIQKNREYNLLYKNGREFPAEISLGVIRDASGSPMRIVVITNDITERKRAEEVVKRKLMFQETVSDISARFVTTRSIDDAIDDSLAEIGRLSGASRSYMFFFRDKDTMDNTHEWCADGIEPQKDDMQGLPINTFPWWMKKLRKGEIIHLTDVSKLPPEAKNEREILESQEIKSLLVLPLNVEGELAGFIGFDNVVGTGRWSNEDISILRTSCEIIGGGLERKQAEDKLRSYSEHLEEMVEEKTRKLKEVERMAAIGETTTMIGHDLRNPLQSLTNNLFIAQREIGKIPSTDNNNQAKKKIETVVGRMQNQIQYMNKIVSDLQDYARTSKYDLMETNLRELINHTISEISIPERVDVSIQVEPDLTLLIDPVLMRRVLSNLMINAMQAMPDGGKLEIESTRKDDEVSIDVRDTGGGIPEENMDKIFNPLFTTKSQGQGFGLAVCKKLVTNLGGTILVKSEVGRGSTFTVTIPLKTQVTSLKDQIEIMFKNQSSVEI